MSFGARFPSPSAGDPCPCGSGSTFGNCCGALLAGEAAPTAERLMRSRYTAFATGDAAYLARTWHPRTRPEEIDLDPRQRWTGLRILDATEDTVAFEADWAEGDERGTLRERSRFTQRGGRWVYVDGDVG